MIQLHDFFHLLSDEIRLRCLVLLVAKKELCVCDLTDILNMTQPKISRHLAILRRYRIISNRREGIWIYYSLHPKLPEWAQKILLTSFNQMKEEKPFSVDLRKLDKLKNCCS
jgi:ArsR family transcriptional regulator, arsenate/arsenite/antimonite-responsive transcriptional repressor